MGGNLECIGYDEFAAVLKDNSFEQSKAMKRLIKTAKETGDKEKLINLFNCIIR